MGTFIVLLFLFIVKGACQDSVTAIGGTGQSVASNPGRGGAKNLDLLEDAMGIAVDAILDSARIERDQIVFLQVHDAHLPWLLESVAVQRMRKLGIKPVAVPDSGDFLLSLAAHTLSIEYPERVSSGIFRSSRTLRRAVARVSGIVIERKTGCYRFAGEETAVRQDTIQISEIPFVESSAIPETRGQPPPTSWWSRILGPLIITGAVLLSVVLFFTVRSS
ncbi:MAG: hypothetical protein ACP5JH_03100 [Bacteroidota bacterium]